MTIFLRAVVVAGLSTALVSSAHADADSKKIPDAEHAPVEQQTELSVAPAGHRITKVVIDNPLGDVRIQGHDGPGLKITAFKRAPDEDTLTRLRVSLTPDAAGPMRIVTAVDGGRESRPVPRRSVRIDLIVEAPRDAWVDGRTGDGRLVVVNMDAGATLDAGTGDIEVHNVSGTLIANSVDAGVSLSQIFGIVEAGALDGDVALDTVRGDRLTASVHKGEIRGRRVRSRDIQLTSTSGDIRIEGQALTGGVVRIATLSGNLDIRLRGAVVVRAHGPKVVLRSAKDQRAEAGGWQVAGYGKATTAASVELVSRHGTVAFASVAPGSPSK